MAASALESLLKKQVALEERIKRLKSKAEEQERKDQTSRQILVGKYFLEKFEQEGSFDKLVKQLDSYLKNPKDRKLFGLAVLEEA